MTTTPTAPIVIDPATGIREINTTFPSCIRVFTNDAARVVVTAGGHWYRSGDVRTSTHDIMCRSCAHHAYFDHNLDAQPCTSPATFEDVRAALAGPARHVQPSNQVRLVVSEYPDPVVGTIRRIYRNAIGQEVAEIDLPGGRDFLQGLEFLTLVA